MSDSINLLDHFALFSTQVVKLHAELHRPLAADEVAQAHVEIKLTPGKINPPVTAATAYQVGVALSCRGVLKDQPEVRVFTLECILNAGYQQIAGEPVSYETFSGSHASLTRQLYPLIHHQLTPILGQLGLHNVRLPQEIVHTRGSTRGTGMTQPVVH